MLLWVLVVYGGALVSVVREHLRTPVGVPGVAVERLWIASAVLLAGAGLTWRGLRAVGPIVASPSEQSWGVATPMDRRRWLLPRFLILLLAGLLGGAAAAGLVVVLGMQGHGFRAALIAGGVWGLGSVAAAVAAQASARPRGHGRRRRRVALAGPVLTLAGAAAAGAVVAAHYGGRLLPRPPAALVPGLVAMGAVFATVALAAAILALRRIDRAALGAGADIAAAALSATAWTDPTLLTRVLEVRRWRRVGRVRSRHFLPAVPGLSPRVWALLQGDARRVARRPMSLVVWAALGLAQYAIAVVAPPVAGVAHVIAAYVAAGRLTSGLRTVAGSAGLRRSIGGGEAELRLVHLVVPAVGTALWWVLTWPAGGPPLGSAEVFLVLGIVAAAYRSATRPPMRYGASTMDSPVGLFPTDLLLQIARGPDLLGVVLIVRLILR